MMLMLLLLLNPVLSSLSEPYLKHAWMAKEVQSTD
jgi:hypothetical protein